MGPLLRMEFSPSQEKRKSVTSPVYSRQPHPVKSSRCFSRTFFPKDFQIKGIWGALHMFMKIYNEYSTLKSQKSAVKNSYLALTQSFPNSFVCQPSFSHYLLSQGTSVMWKHFGKVGVQIRGPTERKSSNQETFSLGYPPAMSSVVASKGWVQMRTSNVTFFAIGLCR